MSDTPAPATSPIRKTALNAMHRQMGGKMTEFGGWDMPVEYSGIIPEHRAVRERAGLFDVSHMGELAVRGHEALALVQHVTSNDASRLSLDQAQYSGLMTAQGTFVDDLLVHKFTDEHYWLVVNAGNCTKDFSYILAQNHFQAQVDNVSDGYTQLAIQGPRALAILQPLTSIALAPIKYYWFTIGKVLGVECIISRTGYTGEDGFELYFDPEHSEKVWTGLLEAGKSSGILPCGLGARNTLRMEAGMALYGHEIDDTTTPLEAGLGWITKLNKPEFLGQAVIEKQQQEGIRRKLVGFEMTEPGIGREGYPVLIGGKPVGHVTSGGPIPGQNRNVGMAYVPVELASPGAGIEIQIRARTVKAKQVPLPFYKRAR
ncbi:MAG: glycine cleavage system aminomethyltransferase GcvT [Acidobacteria bacterium]|nr:MAG: glycine cleavage system aminomethyltransferase GcvT [Acidobacteriota bacterium]